MTADTTRHITRVWLRLLLMAVAAVVSCVCRAQNNAYNIKDELYAMYVEAYRDRTTMKGLQLSTRLYNRAVQLGDRKAQCLAYTLPVSYYYYRRDMEEQFVHAVSRLQDIAMRLDCPQYYYFGVSNMVNFLLNGNQTDKAISYVHEAADFARRHNHKFGIYVCMCANGQINLSSRETHTAMHYYREALAMATKQLPNVDPSNLYRKIADCYADLYEYPQMLEYGLKAYQSSSTPITRQRTLRAVCYPLFMLGRMDEFDKYFGIYRALKGSVNPDSRDTEERDMAILEMLRNRDFDNAYKYIMQRQRTLPRLRLLAKYYRMRGDTKALATTQRQMYRIQIRDCDSVRSQNYEATYARFINFRLDLQHQQLATQRQHLETERKSSELRNTNLQLANTQLTLRNSSLKLSRTRSEADMLRLSFSKKRLEADKLRGEIKAAKMHQSLNSTISVLGAVIGVLLTIAIGVYLWTRSRLMFDLRQTNTVLARNHSLLTKAKNHAEEANNVKTDFIQNMAGDIRTPLNAIVRLANAISKSTRETPAEKLGEMNRQLEDNTAKLLRIVDNALNKQRKE